MNRYAHVMACGAFALLLAASGAARAADEVLALDNFRERVTKEVPVSGRMLVGAAVMGAVGARATLTPRLMWPGKAGAAATSGLCVTFASRDGIFNSDGEIPAARLATLSGTPAVQGVRSREGLSHVEVLARDDLAVLATRGGCTVGESESDLTQVLLLDRRESTAGDAVLQLAINPQNYAVAVDLQAAGGTKQPMACARLDDSRRSKSYSLQCTVALPGQVTEATVFIERRKNERAFAARVYRLTWAKP